MKNLLTGIVALIVGAFTLIFATIVGLFVSVAALLTTPFIKRKVAYAQAEAHFEQGSRPAGFGRQQQSRVIDGEYEDISANSDRKF
ncbi:hypothetical protein A3K86_15615 [Photobacterium jeanii]|uniref:Hydroxylamine reductase n=1 Tax=Photobacterium jeanii TaxID=858640 RepID=A0A178K6Z2_9GAMM|nr:hypothetical protein [Photobacterium jeanii]OAN13090.1 hypothetical protein A3K86_15615 [Photobacterium jeanii]PST89240.1 hypothetical protein C9I91_14060 [Photobacterium jeanii]